MNHKQSGFTLIEALVAGIILFAAIAVSTQVYRGALMASQTAEKLNRTQSAVVLLKSGIRHRLDQGESSGEGQFDGLAYQWQAEVIETAYQYTSGFGDGQENRRSTGGAELRKTGISLSIGNPERQQAWRQYQWQEVLWQAP